MNDSVQNADLRADPPVDVPMKTGGIIRHCPTLRSVLVALFTGAIVLISGCATIIAPKPAATETAQCPAPAATPATPAACPACPLCPAPRPEPPVVIKVPVLEAAPFSSIPGWGEDDLQAFWGAFRASCQALRFQPAWRAACGEAARLESPDATVIRRYLENEFIAYRTSTPEGVSEGLATGYYEPLLRGSRTRRAPFLYPLFSPPDDLLTIDLSAINPDLRNMRLRGRVEGRRVVPYWSRAEIDRGLAPLAGKEIVWVDDPIEAFFLEVQGSGRVRLDSGQTIRVNYADQNGQPYQSIGRWLVDRGELKINEASMQGIKAWAKANPARLSEMLNQNPSYVFFRELAVDDPSIGPTGAQGVPLTAERSVAVDPRFVPLGAPVFIATTRPNSDVPMRRLMMAQDTGGAIRGPVRVDFFWGFGAEAGTQAGRMRQSLKSWVLLPKGYPLKPDGTL